MRKMNVPSLPRANSQLKRLARAEPTWKYPVGEGANLTLGPVTDLLLDRDRAVGTTGDRLGHPLGELGAGVFVQDVEVTVVADLEDLGGDAHADRVAGAQVEVDVDLHGDSFGSSHHGTGHPGARADCVH